MYILPLIGYAGVLLGFGFLTLAIASGLYYLSELVEEHTVLARKLLTRLIYTIIAIQALLALIDRFPFLLSAVSIASHAVYMGNLRHFPIVKLTDPVFILSCLLVFLNHFLWFHHFSHPPSSPPSYSTYDHYPTSSLYTTPQMPSFTEIASYFGICVWLVPFALFVSLSAGENVLPSMGSEYATGGSIGGTSSGGGDVGGGGLGATTGDGRRRRKKGLVKAVVDWGVEWVGETWGVLRGEKGRRF
ncbi:hypothetical protein JMJ35_001212 [Cladonia borealis]|uniref:DUF396-domain-containing protein n=1 Tax=Cladonia borealis TaxID=184061 RepID=A0AA39RAD2_9LECA|nr:hypothetical protein JMJ35_001212 [Cladonia borealis]